MSEVEKKCTASPEKNQSSRQLNISGKFRAYRLLAESTKTKLKEAQTVTEELKNEINFSRNAEKNLRSQIASTQNRLISLQETVKKFINISDKQRQNEKISQRIQERIQELEENINIIRKKSEILLQYTTREVDLLKKVKELESVLEAKNGECDLMKVEIQTLVSEKKNMEIKFQEKLENLERSVEDLRKKENETQVQFRETLLYYKNQIEDYEQRIERYEKERRSFLEEFEFPKPSEVNNNKVAWPDSTINIIQEKRPSKPPISKKQNKIQMESNELNCKNFQCSPIIGKSDFSSLKKTRNSSKISKKQKPQLEFLTQESSVTVNSEGSGRKRRLFSTNSNHYID